MTAQGKSERLDLSKRTALFAKNVRSWIRQLPRGISWSDDSKQLLRSSGSVAANFIEANESLSKKDCGMRLKICRKEARESELWLDLLGFSLPSLLENERSKLAKEALELKLILNAIIRNTIPNFSLASFPSLASGFWSLASS